jgi:PAS domain S-box-containing protein
MSSAPPSTPTAAPQGAGEGLWRAAFDQARGLMALVDDLGAVVDINAAALSAIGTSRAQMIGQPFWDMPWWTHSAAEQARIRAAVAQAARGEASGFETTHRTADGGLRHIQFFLNPVRDPQGTITAILAEGSDVTEKWLAPFRQEAGQSLLRTLIDSIPDLIFFKDTNSTFLGCNAAFETFVCRDEAEIIGRTDFDLVDSATAEMFRRQDQEMLAKGRPLLIDEWMTRPDGSRVLLETVKTPLVAPDGGMLGVIAIARDITARKQAEDAVLRKEAYLRAILDNFPFLIWLKDTEGRLLEANTAFAAASGRASVDQVVGKTDFDIWPADLAARYRADDVEVLSQRSRKCIEEPVGRIPALRWMETLKMPVVDAKGQLLGTAGFSQDITKDRLAKQALEESERRYRLLFDTMFDAFALHEIVLDDDGNAIDYRFIDVNPAFERFTGLRRKDVIGRRVTELLPGLERFWIETYGRVTQTGEPVQFVRLSSEMNRHFEVSAFRPAQGQFACIFMDVTDRLNAELAMRESEERYRMLVQHSPVGIVHYGRDLRIAYCNQRFADIVHSDRQRLLSLDMEALPHQQVVAALRTAIEGRTGHFKGRYRSQLSGQEIWISMVCSPVVDADGTVTGGIAIVEDTTEQVQTAESLRKLSLVVEQCPISVVITDTDGAIEYVNPQFTVATGYSPRELLGQNPRVLQGGDKTADEYAELWATIKSGRTWHGQFHNKRKDGTLYWEEAIISPVRDANGGITHFVGIKQDVTERWTKDEELRKAVDRLTETNTELERFAYVASHDLQEPLRTLASFTQLLERRYRGRLDTTADEYIDFIVGASRRMHALINDLLAYSRVTGRGRAFALIPSAQACDLAIRNLHERIEETAARITIGTLPAVLGDELQLMQVFQNLIGNAIKFHRPDVAPVITIGAHQQDAEWQFFVTDNGIGIEQTTQDIFEIFRRLHAHSQYPGTGVGLAICKRIIQRHGGRIWMESCPGKGSTFFFSLPLAATLSP